MGRISCYDRAFTDHRFIIFLGKFAKNTSIDGSFCHFPIFLCGRTTLEWHAHDFRKVEVFEEVLYHNNVNICLRIGRFVIIWLLLKRTQFSSSRRNKNLYTWASPLVPFSSIIKRMVGVIDSFRSEAIFISVKEMSLRLRLLEVR